MKSIVVFDGNCDLCNWSVGFIKRTNPRGQYNYLPFSSADESGVLQESGINTNDPDEVLLIEDKKVFRGAEAIQQILLQSSNGWRFVGCIMKITPLWIKKRTYRFVAANRSKVRFCKIN